MKVEMSLVVIPIALAFGGILAFIDYGIYRVFQPIKEGAVKR